MSVETIGVIAFVVVVYGAFYIMAQKAERHVKAQAKQRLEMQQEKMKNGSGGKRASKLTK